MSLRGRGVLMHLQRAPGKAPSCPGCPLVPRASLGSLVRLGERGVLLHICSGPWERCLCVWDVCGRQELN